MNGSECERHRFNLIASRQTGIGIFWANTTHSQLVSWIGPKTLWWPRTSRFRKKSISRIELLTTRLENYHRRIPSMTLNRRSSGFWMRVPLMPLVAGRTACSPLAAFTLLPILRAPLRRKPTIIDIPLRYCRRTQMNVSQFNKAYLRFTATNDPHWTRL